MKKICVVGLGYIGLPTATLLATKGYEVVGVDLNKTVVDKINHGEAHIVEPDLNALVEAAVSSGRLRAVNMPIPADAFIICVPTPVGQRKHADLSYVRSASESIFPHLKKGNLVVVESTIPPLTTEELVLPILKRSGLQVGSDILLAHCPERVLPGKILIELEQNDRVIGGYNNKSALLAKELYSRITQGKLYLTDLKTAEFVKLIENSYRDVNIAFANELSKICNYLNINVWEAITLANKHPRVNILKPGPGVGGHCIAVDPWFIIEKAKGLAKLLRTARLVNDSMPATVVKKVEEAVKKIRKPKIACLGLAYKADTDDARESPAVEIIHLLSKKGFKLSIHDPYINKLPGYKITSLKQALNGTDCVLLLVDHKIYRAADIQTLLSRQKKTIIIDTRGIWNP